MWTPRTERQTKRARRTDQLLLWRFLWSSLVLLADIARLPEIVVNLVRTQTTA